VIFSIEGEQLGSHCEGRHRFTRWRQSKMGYAQASDSQRKSSWKKEVIWRRRKGMRKEVMQENEISCPSAGEISMEQTRLASNDGWAASSHAAFLSFAWLLLRSHSSISSHRTCGMCDLSYGLLGDWSVCRLHVSRPLHYCFSFVILWPELGCYTSVCFRRKSWVT